MSYILGSLYEFASTLDLSNPFAIFWYIFSSGGWVLIVLLLLWGFWQLWLNHITGKYSSALEWIFLAIDVPRENEQSLKAVEQMFAQLAGAHATLSFMDKYWIGKSQDSFSFEIVSIDGHIQYIVRCLVKHKDLVESTIYAQYPDAEITEVEDYTKNVPDAKDWPQKDWDLWGTEVILAKDEHYPIKTYPYFEHSPITKESLFADPLNAVLEIMGKMQPGEQVWFQFVISHPDKPGWGDPGKIVDKLMGKKIKNDEKTWQKAMDAPLKALSYISEEAVGAGFFPEEGEKVDDKPDWGALALSPGEVDVIKAVQMKASKLGFHTKFRIVYIGKKDVFNKSRVPALFGAVKQYNTQNLNSFKPDTKYTMTGALYFRVKQRVLVKQRNILAAYKSRSTWKGTGKGKILNIEELASIWHFPLLSVTAPAVKKAEAKKAGAPANLMFEDQLAPLMEAEKQKKKAAEPKPAPAEPPDIVSARDQIINQSTSVKQAVKTVKKATSKEKPTSSGDIGPPTNLPI